MALYSEEHLNLLRSLTNHDVRFMIIGGHAAIYYGVNRNTGDLDLFIEPTIENGTRIIEALKALNLEVPEIQPEEFIKNIVLTFGFAPDAVDIINYTAGITFETAYANAVITEFSGINVRIIDIRDLLKNKEALNRFGEKSLLDKYDAEVLKKIIISKNQS